MCPAFIPGHIQKETPQWMAVVSPESLSNILGISGSMFSIVKEKKTRFFLEDVEESPMVRNHPESERSKQGGSGGLAWGCVGPGLVPQGHTLVKPITLYHYNLHLFYMYLYFNRSSKKIAPSPYPGKHLKHK